MTVTTFINPSPVTEKFLPLTRSLSPLAGRGEVLSPWSYSFRLVDAVKGGA